MNYEELFRRIPEARTYVIKLLNQGVPRKHLAEALGVSRQCIYNWSKKEREIDMISRDPEFKASQSAIIKIIEDIPNKSPEQRAEDRWRQQKVLRESNYLRSEVVRLVKQGYSVADLASTLGVTPPAIVYWEEQSDAEQHEEENFQSQWRELRRVLDHTLSQSRN